MKTTVILISTLVVLASCGDGTNQNREQAKNDLRIYVDSVETALATTADHNWDEIERRYDHLEDRADRAFENASDETKVEVDGIEAKFERMRDDYNSRQAEFKRKADAQMAEVESWYDRTTDD